MSKVKHHFDESQIRRGFCVCGLPFSSHPMTLKGISVDPGEVGTAFASLRSPGVMGILEAAMETFQERNGEYGENYKQLGAALLELFPGRVIPEIRTADDANRLNLIIDCLGKLQRYSFNFAAGGHRDSSKDLIVYAAMLTEMTK